MRNIEWYLVEFIKLEQMKPLGNKRIIKSSILKSIRTWKPHYYFTSRHFYNFPYAFGLLFAKGLYAQYVERPETFPSEYEKLLARTGKMKIADVTASVGIDVHDIEFWRASLKTVEEDIDTFIKLSYEI